ncbi:MAG TPA: RHS repeat-associated core domain-containing protein [Rhodanobacter sp.]|nr:RHS repeat-associated core domain-containing protein [Rhodanobacter sp.]
MGLLLSITGPRTDITAVAHYSYYLSTDESGCGTVGGACHRAGDLYQVTDALGHISTIMAYDKAGRVVRERNANGVLVDLTYHARGWLLSRTVHGYADGSNAWADSTKRITYNADGTVNKVTDADGVFVVYTYDPAHRLTDITDATGNYIHYTLDASGNRVAEQIFDAGKTLHRSLTRKYNALGQLTSIIDGLNNTVYSASYSDSYDGNGNLAHTADGLGVQQKSSYDALNRLFTTINNYNGTDTATQNTSSVFAYDALDRLEGVSDPDGLNTSYDYDGLSNPNVVHSPDTGTAPAVYDMAGNRTQLTDAKGVVSTYTYDALNRVTSISYADPTLNVSYHYDELGSCASAYTFPIGHMTSIVEYGVSTAFCYDSLGHVLIKGVTDSTSNTNLATAFSYTPAGRLSGVRSPQRVLITYGRDANGNILNVTNRPPLGPVTVGNVVSNVLYLPFGPILHYTLGNGQTTTRSYDANYRLTDLTSPALNLHFALDVMGNIKALGDAPGASPSTETYGYDPLYRLASVNNSAGTAIESYTYSKTGDRLSKTGNGLATGVYSYQSGTHWLNAIGNAARAYDANGNTTANAIAGQTYGFGYDGRNRMTVVQINGQTVATYRYSALGERISKTATLPQTVTEEFVYDASGHLIEEIGTTNRDYIWLGNLPVAAVDTTANGTSIATYYVHADALGTPRVVSDASGATLWQWAYQGNPFGEQQPTSANGFSFNLRRLGQYFDAESGLLHNGSRDYCAECGRYVQSDPIGLSGGISTYAYVGSNPLVYTDPNGQDSVGEMIDANGLQAASNENYLATYGWAFASAAWGVFGAESLSKVSDRGPAASCPGDKFRAGLEVLSAFPPIKIVRGASEAASAMERAVEIASTMSARTRGGVTIAVTETEEGTRIISSNEASLRSVAQEALQEGEIAVKGVNGVHAEVNGINGAIDMGLTPIGTAASRAICPFCATSLDKYFVTPLSPLKKIK